MKLPKLSGNWGLKLLALVLAIVTYYALKTDSSHPKDKDDNRLFHYR